jgi:hypothetical protein
MKTVSSGLKKALLDERKSELQGYIDAHVVNMNAIKFHTTNMCNFMEMQL